MGALGDVVDDDQPIGEYPLRVRGRRAMSRCRAAVRLDLVAQVSDVSSGEIERDIGDSGPPTAQLARQIVEHGARCGTAAGARLDADVAVAHPVPHHLRQRPRRVAQVGEPIQTRLHVRAVEPERMRGSLIQPQERGLGIHRPLHHPVQHRQLGRIMIGTLCGRRLRGGPSHEHPGVLRGSGSAIMTAGGGRGARIGAWPGRSGIRVLKRERGRAGAGGRSWCRGPAADGVLPGQPGEIAQDRRAVLARDGLRMELHAPLRPVPVPHPHHHPVGGGRGDLEGLRQRLGGAQRVIADRGELPRQSGEQVAAVVADPIGIAVPGSGRGGDRPARREHDALMSQADPEQRQIRLLDQPPGDAEIPWHIRPSGTGGDDDVVEVPQRRTVGLVVAHHDRIDPVHLGDQLEEVVGERVVVVDEQGANRRERAARPCRSSFVHRCLAGVRPGCCRPAVRTSSVPIGAAPPPVRERIVLMISSYRVRANGPHTVLMAYARSCRGRLVHNVGHVCGATSRGGS